VFDRIIHWLFDKLEVIPQMISADAEHHQIIRGFAVFLLILLALFLLSYARSFFAHSKRKERDRSIR
jgi:cbb3-type cytochrome oxidase subunit 3